MKYEYSTSFTSVSILKVKLTIGCSFLVDGSVKLFVVSLKKIFDDEELDENLVVINFAATASMEKIIIVKIYNIDVIISLGYSVNSKQDTHFCRLATKVLKDYNNNA